MVNVIAWPPVGLVGWEITRIDKANVERGILTNIRRSSASQVRRRELVPVVSALALDAVGSGYMHELIEQLDGGRHLIRIEADSAIWHLRSANARFGNELLEWTSGGTELLWTAGGVDLIWGSGEFALHGVPGTSGGRPILTVSGFPPDTLVCRPSERVRVMDGDTEQEARVITVAYSNADGVAVLVLASALTLTGLVSLGVRESIVCEAMDTPRAIQPVSQNWTYQWRLREVFQAETETWDEVNPWPPVSA